MLDTVYLLYSNKLSKDLMAVFTNRADADIVCAAINKDDTSRRLERPRRVSPDAARQLGVGEHLAHADVHLLERGAGQLPLAPARVRAYPEHRSLAVVERHVVHHHAADGRVGYIAHRRPVAVQRGPRQLAGGLARHVPLVRVLGHCRAV